MDVKKAIGLDGMSGWTLRECRVQLVESVWDVINSYVMEGRVKESGKEQV